MKIIINKETCIGCGSCEAVASDLFAIKDGKAIAKKKNVSGDDLKKAKEAVDICPVQSITLK